MSDKKLVAISASRLKVLKDCSWLYWCKYGPMKLHDKTNKGALSGTCCHTVFECLLKPRHRKLHEQVVKTPATIRNCPVIERYVKFYAKKNGLEEESIRLIDAMIVVGLMYDFYCLKGNGQELEAERRFDIVSEKYGYRITGFIDKMAKYIAKNLLRVVDYKSSKRQFEGDDLDSNLQAQIYSVAARYIYPDLKPIVEFIFLQFPKNPVQRLRFSDAQLDEFEKYLGEMSKVMNNFTLKDALSDFAADKGLSQKGFGGLLMCGWLGKRGPVKSPNDTKANGEPAYYCAYKFPFDYYSLCNADDEVIRSSPRDDLAPNAAKGEYVIKKRYAGCPAWNGTKAALLRKAS